VGYDFGGVGVYRDGHLRDANAVDRPGGSVISIAAGPDGDIWITANSHGKAELRQFHKGRWIIHTPANGLADEPIQSVFVARDAAVWIAQYPTLLRLKPGAQRPEKMPVKAASAATFAQDATGTVWLAGSEGLRRLSAPYPLTRTDADMANANPGGQQSLLFEDGSAWLAGHEEGLILLHPAQRRETVKVRSVTLLRDREGTIWGGGPDGLVSYIRSSLFRQDIAGIPTSGFALSPAPDHPIYVGTQDGAYEIAGGQARMVLRAKSVEQICPGPAGALWVSSSPRRYLRRGGVWTSFAHGPAPGYTDRPAPWTRMAIPGSRRRRWAFTIWTMASGGAKMTGPPWNPSSATGRTGSMPTARCRR
jgi:ligand-binding sensor domain-containing protein